MKVVVKTFGAAFSVAVIPVLRDNYTYVIHDQATNAVAAVDVSADTAPVLDYVQRLSKSTKKGDAGEVRFSTILSTHRHVDHTGGNIALLKKLGSSGTFNIIGGVNDNIPGVTQTVREGDRVSLGALQVEVLDVPCHTRGHVLYKVYHPKSVGDGVALFTGDTLFVGGIGAFFEGDAALMCRAMRKVYDLHQGASDREAAEHRIFVFPGHEYTVNFLEFTRAAIPPTHPDAAFIASQLERYKESVAQCTPTVPSSLAEEKRQNLFLRTCDTSFVREMRHGDTAEALMQYLYDTCP
ncbi:hydroxyacylglutathione hydrolase [Trypanosoma rangeli]|uniref:Hydroxyacylglutathione hydrolase n=1 Tax=Trypanosoma rangeli TaxID=5698 RepID=A0A3S5IRV9_TRYRA|nr:hydroxyacylglutathione hydrolase [Trypanosoma rangeli]RNF09088.1 hydroxyacylglutathione hydrolase [Trypanosoma rangeli]|eukprot:RNF09088.1 hydroxyacylglutathione hydrolase [Trypanosoma rangeli]